jgi:hypothetical protein
MIGTAEFVTGLNSGTSYPWKTYYMGLSLMGVIPPRDVFLKSKEDVLSTDVFYLPNSFKLGELFPSNFVEDFFSR